ncbi:NAD(P)-dependent oxidoreductase [Flavihumibacter fluvii]|uniref:NAD(P)-dependent oxidoreductase n=1 Tax=Flavihumibacter fluvii TaxID=2838157 RepID=UPI001BDE15FA|nr:NAD(P)-binding domain-containing protein [Flavihumibacter fluvii]ULQ52240.1 NAD(P)-binding domain-containing protein [Flavihumibacter fluvii]
MIAFLGTGLLGANFTKALLAKGENVQVWNRTADKAKALEAAGAKAFDNAADAVKGAIRIHITLSDDAVVDAVLEQAAAGLEPGAFILDHTTTSAEGAILRTKKWAEKGFTYVHAPVFMGPVNALDSSGFMLISENEEITKKVSPWLSAMTGKLLSFGNTTGKAAGIKLIGNLFLLTLTGGLSDMLALAKSLNISGNEISTLFESFNPGAAAPSRLKRLMQADYDNPSWELQMARKDARLMMEAAAKGNNSLVLVPQIAKEMDRFLAKDFAHKDWSIIVSENL